MQKRFTNFPVLNTLPVFLNIRRRYCRSGWAKLKENYKELKIKL